MTISKVGKQSIPPGKPDSPAARKRLRSLTLRSSNRFAPIDPEEADAEMDLPDEAPSTPSLPSFNPPEQILADDPRALTPSPSLSSVPKPLVAPGQVNDEAAEEDLAKTPLAPFANLLAEDATAPKQPSPSPGGNAANVSRPPPAPFTGIASLKDHLAVAAENRRRHLPYSSPVNTHGSFPTHTPRPVEGFPVTHLTHGAQLFDGMHRGVVDSWDVEVPDPKLLARIFDFNAETTTPETTKAIITAMEKVLNGIAYELQPAPFTPIKVAPPSRGPEATIAPSAFLIYKIPEAVVPLLLRTRVWSTPTITFEVWEFQPSFPLFLFPLDGFITDNEEDISLIIKNTWDTPKVNSELARLFAEDPSCPRNTDLGAHHAYITEAFERLEDSLIVKYLDMRMTGNISTPRFNVFAALPTSDPNTWIRIHTALERQTYIAPLDGTGRVGPLKHCQICNCVTHPRGLCPFPKIEGWLGPKIAPAAKTEPKRKGRRVAN